jgi:hypothetical protein
VDALKQDAIEHVECTLLALACKKLIFWYTCPYCALSHPGTGGWYRLVCLYGCLLCPLEILHLLCVWWRSQYGRAVRPRPTIPMVAKLIVTSLEKFLVSSLLHRSGTGGSYG